MADLDTLLHVLAVNRAHGSVGEHSLEDAVAHADQYVAAMPPAISEHAAHGQETAARAGVAALQLADLGSGGGLPELVIAVRRPDLQITLIERRANRADQLRRSLRTLDIVERVEVLTDDVRAVAQRRRGTFDIVTARSFAAPDVTARFASALLRDGGVLIVSEPPVDDAERWPPSLLAAAQLADQGRRLGIRVFQRLPRA